MVPWLRGFFFFYPSFSATARLRSLRSGVPPTYLESSYNTVTLYPKALTMMPASAHCRPKCAQARRRLQGARPAGRPEPGPELRPATARPSAARRHWNLPRLLLRPALPRRAGQARSSQGTGRRRRLGHRPACGADKAEVQWPMAWPQARRFRLQAVHTQGAERLWVEACV